MIAYKTCLLNYLRKLTERKTCKGILKPYAKNGIYKLKTSKFWLGILSIIKKTINSPTKKRTCTQILVRFLKVLN